MKGTVFQKPFEFSLLTKEEQWAQGDSVNGTVKVKSHSNETTKLKNIKVSLAYGTFKKVRAKDDKAWEIIDSVIVEENVELTPQEEKIFKWKFQLTSDCPITDNQGSLYLIYGSEEDHWKCGQLQLTVDLIAILQEYLRIFDHFFRFKLKTKKFKKDGITEVKLIPPKSKELSQINHLLCQLRFHQDIMDIKYIFQVNALEMDGDQAKVQKKKRKFDQQLDSKQYHAFGGSPNHEGLKSAIDDVIQKVIPKILY